VKENMSSNRRDRENLSLRLISPQKSSPRKRPFESNNFLMEKKLRRCPHCNRYHPGSPQICASVHNDMSLSELNKDVSIRQVFGRFYQTLIESLPMDDPVFSKKLYAISGNSIRYVKICKLRCFSATARAKFFLDNVIRPSVVSGDGSKLHDLIEVIKGIEDDYLQELAKQISSSLAGKDLFLSSEDGK